MGRYCLIITLGVLVALLPVHAQGSAPTLADAPLRFRHLTIDDGLSQNAIYALLQDRRGFVWIGTKDGLNRYDGAAFTVFRHDPFRAATLPSSHVTALLEAQDGMLWVGTQDGGVSRLDPSTGIATRYRHTPRQPITALAEDAAGHVWIGTTGGGVYRLDAAVRDRADADFEAFRHDEDDARSLSHDEVRALLVDRAGTVWVGTENGLDRYDGGGFRHYRHRPDLPDGLADRTVASLYEDREGRLWVGSFVGISRMDSAQGGLFTHFRYASPRRGHGWGAISGIAEGPSGQLWLATLDGLLRLDPATGTTQVTRPDPLSSTSLSSSGITRLLWDRTGVLWIGTNGYGLDLYDAKAARFETILRPPDPASRLDGFSVRAIYEDRQDGLWIGAGVLYRLDRRTHTLTTFEQGEAAPSAFGNAGVWSITQDREGALWFASYEGLFRRDPTTGQTRRYAYDTQVPDGLPSKVVYGVFESRAGAIWAVLARSLCLLDDPGEGRFTCFPHGAPGGALFPSLHESDDGLFWMGTETGLVRFDPTTGDVHRYRTDAADPASLANERVRAILPDPSDPDVLWLGTAGGGLARFDRRTETFRHITQADGLPNNVVYAVLPDSQGRLWLSTNLGLARYNPQTGAVKTYDVRDGLQSNEFNSGAYHQGRDGRLYVGGIHGVTVFDPDALSDNPHVPAVVLTGLRVGNRPVAVGDSTGLLDQALWATETLHLGHREALVTFEFAALDFSAPEKNRYAYRMEGYDDDWIDGGTNRTATYTRLPPGRYTFRVRGTNNDGVWNDEGASLALVIAPPPWRAWWAYVGYVLIVLGVAVAFYRNRRRRLLLRHRLEIEYLEAEKLRELDRAKSRLFANVSHEFRTPLTLTIGPLDDLQAGRLGPLTPDMAEHVDLARRNAKRVLGLINQILDVARLEAGRLPLRARPLDLEDFVTRCVGPYRAAAEHAGVTIEIDPARTAIEVWADPAHLEKVLANLLSNALKYTPAGGAVQVRIAADAEAAYVAVRDSGPGIPAEAIGHVFDRFYRVDEAVSQPGTGIGLALAKEIADLHGGTLAVESEEGFGSLFTLALPLGRAHLADDQIADVEMAETWSPDLLLESRPGPRVSGADGKAGQLSNAPTSIQGEAGEPEEDRTTVLVVEDHEDVRAYVRSHLEAPGPDGSAYRVIEAVDGQDGLDQARARLPDLIVSDVMMPRLDGFGLCRALRADSETDFLPIILLTAKAEAEDRLQGLAEACDDYLTKPFEPRELRARVDNLIAQRRRLRERYRQDGIALVLGDDEAPALHPDPLEAPSAEAVFLETVRGLIEAHLSDDTFGVGELAAAVGLSRTQLYRRLRDLIEETPSDLLRRMRLERAAELLDARAGTVSEVAYAVGYKSVSHFSNGFTRHMGVRPSAYTERATDATPLQDG